MRWPTSHKPAPEHGNSPLLRQCRLHSLWQWSVTDELICVRSACVSSSWLGEGSLDGRPVDRLLTC